MKSTMLLLVLLGSLSAQQANITITYKQASDEFTNTALLPPSLSLSEAMVALVGKEGRWEKMFEKKRNGEVVRFTEFDPKNTHVISVRLHDVEALNGLRPGKGFESGEAYKYEIPPGSYNFELAPVSCEGKDNNTHLTYALFPAGKKDPIFPPGYLKHCRAKWFWQK